LRFLKLSPFARTSRRALAQRRLYTLEVFRCRRASVAVSLAME
jgi:hypothetical protein